MILGYAFANALNTVSTYLTWVPFAVIALAVIVFVGLHFRRRAREQAEGSSYAASDVAEDYPGGDGQLTRRK